MRHMAMKTLGDWRGDPVMGDDDNGAGGIK
jgi:hypothetical protein